VLRKRNTLLFVGQHLRDFEVLNNTIPKLAQEIVDLKVNVVLHPGYVSKIQTNSHIDIFTKVDDKTLLKFYQEACALYLPMLNSTACNSLLEAMACGLPIITSNVGGNTNYLEDTESILIEKGANDKLIKETKCLLDDNVRMEE